MQKSKQFEKYLLAIQFVFVIDGCGVKGKPTPPDEQPVIGTGESLIDTQTHKRAEQEKALKKRPTKNESN